ncbi:hypothetical protein [Clostridium formicaceticum]|uniref:Diaminopimelate epimerase n=1 Tax=Clostridium formicaceticum TaxID=1497 RepID=A0AAC9WHB5_9CLOT|nr:hypothetical protein [Clostridium formicaceticum]AOY74584.1 hypothetical protein BJL90_00610 [Clostridium formicaceticum]ARE88947.1 hypothetical protein CLFO_33530 [Clostridium formicaceticum]
MKVQFIKVNPTENMTILVESHHKRKNYHLIASRVMAYDNVFAEQVGFIESPESEMASARLQMTAGEFCSNAAMSLAAVLAWKKNLQPKNLMKVPLEVSGTKHLMNCQVKAQQNSYLCKIDMPLPRSINKKKISCNGLIIPIIILKYQGVVHAIVEVKQFDNSIKEIAQIIIKSPELWEGEGVVGLLLYRKSSNEMKPLVYIPKTEDMIWERGCGLGSASLGAYVAKETEGEVYLEIKQPGGIIEVWAECQKGIITNLTIQGHVKIAAVGTAFI